MPDEDGNKALYCILAGRPISFSLTFLCLVILCTHQLYKTGTCTEAPIVDPREHGEDLTIMIIVLNILLSKIAFGVLHYV